MDQTTAESIDIAAILNTYVYMDTQSTDYHNKTLSEILKHIPNEVEKTGDYKAVEAAVSKNSTLGEMRLVSQSMIDGSDENGDLIIACAFQAPNGDIYIAYRGTGDGKWVDNGVGIANESSIMQRAANEYFDKVVEDLGLENYEAGRIVVTGHSKGGNEAQYVTLNSKYGYLIDDCYSIDGQGFSKEAIDHFIEEQGEPYFRLQCEKMYSINGENDYVHDLGIPVIPPENTYFIETPDAKSVAGYHDIKQMLKGEGLNWKIDDNGNYVPVEQGPVGKLAGVISEKMRNLGQEDLEDCAVTIMSLVELILPYENENGEDIIGGYHKFGTGDVPFMTAEEFFGFLAYGLPMLIDVFLTTEEGQEILESIIKSGLEKVKAELGVPGLIGVAYFVSLALPLVFYTTVTGISACIIIGKIADWICDIAAKIDDIGAHLANWLSELRDGIYEAVYKLQLKINSGTSGGRYAADHPLIKVDTTRMRNYASRLYSVNRRISSLDHRLDSLYWRVGLLGLWDLMQADVLTGYSWRLNRCASYLTETATDFENIENDLVGKIR